MKNQRQFKFRVWSNDRKSFEYFTFGDIFGCDCPDWNTENVQQFTGLKDKNGKEIYEGDIVQICDDFEFNEKYPSEYQIKYEISKTGDCIYPAGFKLKSKNNKTCVWSWTEIKVIGNIFENPELLKIS